MKVRTQPGLLLVLVFALAWIGCGDSDSGGTETSPASNVEDVVETEKDSEQGEPEEDAAASDAAAETPDDCPKAVGFASTCNPYCQTGCPENQQCTIKAGQLGCTAFSEKQQGEICSQSEQCAAGLACFKLNDEIDSICRAFCIDDDDCGSDRKCDLNVNFGDGQLTFCGEVTVGCNAFNNPIADCEANCTGKECGTDGCGGACGDCAEGTTCSAGNLCVAECVPQCGDATCGDDGCGGTCGECTWEGEVCFEGTCCEPSCEGKVCGDDGCGGACGECGDGEACDAEGICVEECVPACDGLTCGDDGCGGVCGECAADETCQEGNCSSCIPVCEGLACGDNGCGGSCGECAEDEVCQDGVCAACIPNCTGKVCGDDGCGGSCGECEEGLSCIEGVVCANACIPNCDEKTCGDDGCGGTCGDCDEGATCEEGLCVAGCTPDCAGKVCGDDGCGGSCGTCEEGLSCIEGVVCSNACVPECDGKSCGDDGCGGLCGECAEDEMCSGTFACIPSCIPSCEGKVCGGDGCGGSCGSCEDGSVCAGGSCVTTPCEEGSACYLTNGATKCMPAGSLGVDEPCYGQPGNACAPGLQCMVTCRPICSTTSEDSPQCADVCPNGAFSEVSPENHIGVCFTAELPAACDIFKQEGCEAGKGCYMVSANGVTAGVACVSAGIVEVGEPCQFGNDCLPGSLCTNGTCQEVCNNNADAPPEESCAEKCGNIASFTPAEWGIGACTDAAPSETCDFWSQDCADTAQQCIPYTNGATCQNSNGDAELGATCGTTQDCLAGLYCSEGACIELCSINEFPSNPAAPICIDVCPGGNFSPVDLTSQIGKCSE